MPQMLGVLLKTKVFRFPTCDLWDFFRSHVSVIQIENFKMLQLSEVFFKLFLDETTISNFRKIYI